MKKIMLSIPLIVLCITCVNITNANSLDSWPKYQHDLTQSGFAPVTITPTTLQLKWKTKINAGFPIQTAPAIKNNVVYVNGKNALYAINLNNGNHLWTKDFRGISTPLINEDGVFSSVLDKKDSWEYYIHFVPFKENTNWSNNSFPITGFNPIVKDGVLYFIKTSSGGTLTGSLHALSLSDGKTLWVNKKYFSAFNSLIIIDNVIYGHSAINAKIYCVNRLNGELLWEKLVSKGTINQFAAFGNKLIVSQNNGGHLFCLNAKNGDLIWEYERWSRTSPAMTENRVIGVSDGEVYCLDASNGKLLWNKRITAEYDLDISDIVATKNTVFIGTPKGILYCLDLKTGMVRWRYATGGITSSPAIVNDQLVIVSKEGNLYDPNYNSGYVYCFDDKCNKPINNFSITINGVVTDEQNKPLSNVMVECVDNKVKTNTKGEFRLTIKNCLGDMLVLAERSDQSKNGRWSGYKVVSINKPGSVNKVFIKTFFKEYEVLFEP